MSRHYALCERDDWMSPGDLMVRVNNVAPVVFDPCAPMSLFDWHCDHGCNGEKGLVPWCVTDDAYGGNGLIADWGRVAVALEGLVYVNPPYGGRRRVIDGWIDKCAAESILGVEIIGCVPASTGAQWFRRIWESASAICFPFGRLSFVKPAVARPASQLRLFGDGEDSTAQEDNNATFWSAIPYWGNRVERFYEAFDGYGFIVEPRRRGGEAARVLGRIASIIEACDEDLVRKPRGGEEGMVVR